MTKLVDVTKLSHYNRISLLLNQGKRHPTTTKDKGFPNNTLRLQGSSQKYIR